MLPYFSWIQQFCQPKLRGRKSLVSIRLYSGSQKSWPLLPLLVEAGFMTHCSHCYNCNCTNRSLRRDGPRNNWLYLVCSKLVFLVLVRCRQALRLKQGSRAGANRTGRGELPMPRGGRHRWGWGEKGTLLCIVHHVSWLIFYKAA